jgi:hypothetical protein
MLLGWAGAIGMLVAGWFLGRCRHYIFCLIVAGITCLFHPFGTVLGVFTIIVLIRPSVKRLFEIGAPPHTLDDEDEDEASFYNDPIRRDPYDIRIARGER